MTFFSLNFFRTCIYEFYEGNDKIIYFYLTEIQADNVFFRIQNFLNIVVSHKINILVLKLWL